MNSKVDSEVANSVLESQCVREKTCNLFQLMFSHTYTVIERFSIECRKTITKLIILASRNRRKQRFKQSEFKANTCDRRQARENTCEQGTIGFGFTSHSSRVARVLSTNHKA